MLSDLWIRLRALFRRNAVESELDDELRFHFEQQVEKFVQSGLPLAQARRHARIVFGGSDQIKEECRDARGVRFLETLAHDVRYGLRMLWKAPGFTAVAVLTLALGIGANTAIFSFIDAVMLSEVPVADPGHVLVLKWAAHARPHKMSMTIYGSCFGRGAAAGAEGCSFSYPIFNRMRSLGDVFSGVAAFAGPEQLALSGNGAASMVSGEIVSGDFFETMGIGAALGRTLQPVDDVADASPVAVLNYGYWKSAFGGSSAAIGKTIRLNNQSFTIVGVANSKFTRLAPGRIQDLWIPISTSTRLGIDWLPKQMDEPGRWWLEVAARTKPGVSGAQAKAATTLALRDEALYGSPLFKEADNPAVEVAPIQEGLAGIREGLSMPLTILMAAAGIVLLIACANVAGLLLARGTARQKEIAVRLALGAGRFRIVQQLLTESILLSVAGGLAGIWLAYCAVGWLEAVISTGGLGHVMLEIQPDARVLGFTTAVTIFTGVLFGLAPALRGIRVNLTPALKESAASLSEPQRNRAGRQRFGLGNGLVVMQVSLSIILLVTAGLLVRTFAKLRSIDPGFDAQNVLLFGINPTLSGYDNARAQNFYDELQRRLSALPGAVSASYSSDPLLAGETWTEDERVEGRADTSTATVDILAVSPRFCETMKIPLLAGRTFNSSDFGPGRGVAIVNESYAHEFLGDRNPMGLHFGGTDAGDTQYEIVGVFRDVRYDNLHREIVPTAYIPFSKGEAHFEVRTAANPAGLIPAVRQTVGDMDNNVPLFDVRSQSEQIDQSLFSEKLVAQLSSLFGALALALACIGLYGLLSYEVARQTREIGIRMALGAQQRDVLRRVVRRGIGTTIFGLAIGLTVALGLTRFFSSLLYGITPSDPLTLIAVAGLLLLVAFVACWIPARRAMRVDPMVALRYE